MLDGIVKIMTLGVVAVMVLWFVKPGSSGPTVIKNVFADADYYVQFLMGK